MRNFGPPNIAPPTEVSANNFKYSSGDDRFENVMVYYHIDSVQRYIQSLGITTAHNSQISADAHDGAGGGGFFSPLIWEFTLATLALASRIAGRMPIRWCTNMAMRFRITRCQVGAS
jgi:hypothetical protein